VENESEKIKVRIVTAQDRHAWHDYVDRCPDATPYCSMAWKDAVEQAYGHRPCYLLAEEGGVITGILPLFIFNIPFSGSSLVSLPFCDIGDILADNEKTRKALLRETIILAEKHKVKKIIIRSCQEHLIENDIFDCHCNVETGKVRMLLQLPGSTKELWDGFKSKLRSQVRKAEKNGLIFRWGGLEDLSDFYDVFSRNMHALGSPVHSKTWIERVLVNYDKNARMGLVFKDEQPIGCGIILCTESMVSIPWASTLRDYNRLSPNMMLYWNFLQYAADNGKKVFDFGRSTLNEGTYRFKKQWGAKPEQLFWYCLNSVHSQKKSSSNNNRAHLEQLWQKMPLSLANVIGPKVRKYISL